MRMFTPKYLALSLVAALGLCFTFLVPPFQKPDENRHFYQSSALARGVTTCQVSSSGEVYLPLDSGVYDFPKSLKYDEIAHTPLRKFFLSDLSWERYSPSAVTSAKDWCSWSFVGYIVPSLGIMLGKLTHLYLVEFYLARLVSFIFFFICLLASLKLATPRDSRWILFYALLPMTIHQASSISYDSLQLALLPLIFAWVGRFLDQTAESKEGSSPIWFILTLGLFVLAKPLSLVYLLLVFLIPNISWRQTILIFSCLLVLTLPYLKPLHYLGLEGGVDPQLQIEVITRDPLYYTQVFLETISTDSLEILKGIVGNFGWLDYQLPIYLYFFYLIGFGYLLSSRGVKTNQLRTGTLLVLLLVVAGYYLSTYAALYISWTSVGHTTIKGVQGRYFLVLIPFVGLVIQELIAKIKSSTQATSFALSLGCLLILGIVVEKIYLRYWDYSDYGVNDLGEPSITHSPVTLNSHNYSLKLEGSAKGVGFYFHLASNPPVTTTYRYTLKSSDCQETKQVGYFSLPTPDRSLKQVVNTHPFSLPQTGVCLALEQISPNTDPVVVIPEGDAIPIHPLYLIPSLTQSSL